MNQSAITTLWQYQRLYRKMHDTILFARILPTVVLSFACILLLFMALLFGLNLPLLLQYLAKCCLLALFALASCFLSWEKVVTRPSGDPKRTLLYCLLGETVLPVIMLILASLFIYWPLFVLSLFPLAFGVTLWLGRSERKIRLALVWLQGIQLGASIFLTTHYLYKTVGPFTVDIASVIVPLLFLALYFIYNLRQMILLCDDSLFIPITPFEENITPAADEDDTSERIEAEDSENFSEEIWEELLEEAGSIPEDPLEEPLEEALKESPEETPEETSEETSEEAAEEPSAEEGEVAVLSDEENPEKNE